MSHSSFLLFTCANVSRTLTFAIQTSSVDESRTSASLQGPDGENGSDGAPGAAGLPGADVSEAPDAFSS